MTRPSALLFGGAILGNAGHYFFQIYMSRNLSMADFGALNALLSLLALISIPSGAIWIVMARRVSELTATEKSDAVGSLFRGVLIRVFLIGGLGCILLVALSKPISGFLNLSSPTPVAILAMVIVVTLGTSTGLGILQGLRRFIYLALNQSLSGLLRLLFGMGLVATGCRLNGALLATLFSATVVWVVSLVPLKRYIRTDRRVHFKYPKELGSKNWAPVMAALFCFAFLTHVDLILVKHFFSADHAGLYAVASILGKAMLSFPISVALVLLPLVSRKRTLNENSQETVKHTLLLAGGFLGVGAVLFLLFPGFFLSLLFGARYTEAADLLRLFGIAILPYGLLYVIINDHLARHLSTFIYFMAAACIIEVVLMYAFHRSMVQILSVFLGVGYGLLALFALQRARLGSRIR